MGKSKKIAKRAAASKLLQSIRQMQSEKAADTVFEEEEDDMLNLVSWGQVSLIRTKKVCAPNVRFFQTSKH